MNPESIRRARTERNLTQKQLAREIGVHSSYLSKIETGKAHPSHLIMLKMETVLQQTPVATKEKKENAPTDFPKRGVDPRNKLNELTGKEWIQETKTVWRQRGLGANHEHTSFERLHPAPFSFQDISRLIRFYTKERMLVLDPFCGVGSTLKAAALENRKGLGIEISEKWAELALARLDEEVPGYEHQTIWCMDIRDAISRIPDETIDFIVTSPPYWNILNKKPDHKTKSVRIDNGLDQNYSNDPRDLGNIHDYDEFLSTLTSILNKLAEKLKPGKYCVLIVSDFKHGSTYYPFHSDFYENVDGSKLQLQGVSVLVQDHKQLYPYGYPYAYVPNIHHQYILHFRKSTERSMNERKRHDGSHQIERKAETETRVVALKKSIEELGKLPYKQGDMASRHWGHKRHSMCSFPSKMKPSLASTLVALFTKSSSVVLDPFSGSGTIPFEAALYGRRCVGADIAPLSYVITSSKIQPPSETEVLLMLDEMERHIRNSWRRAAMSNMEKEISDFYHKRTAKEIISARDYLRDQSYGFKRGDSALFVLACLAHIMHGNRPYALSRRSHNIIPIPPKGETIYKPVMKSLREKCMRMLSYPLPSSFQLGEAMCTNSRSLPIDDNSIDVILTSPSFLGTTDFLRQNRLRNWLVGWDYQTQNRMRDEFLEHKTAVEGYQEIIPELSRVLKPGGTAVFHVGVVRKSNMADMLEPIFSQNGLEEVGRVWEDTTALESHGRTDRGGTHTHGFIVSVNNS